MITCERAVDLLLDFLEGNLSPEVRKGLVKHFDDCPPCVRFVESYKKTTALCQEALRRQAPAEFGERLMRFLRQQAKGRVS